MATMGDDALFVDTNVLVYANVAEAPFHRQALSALKQAHLAGKTLTERLLGLLTEHRIGGKRVHDANIVATMMACGIPTLLTHNVADFERFGKQIALESIV